MGHDENDVSRTASHQPRDARTQFLYVLRIQYLDWNIGGNRRLDEWCPNGIKLFRMIAQMCERKELNTLWMQGDRDHSGTITLEEFRCTCRHHNYRRRVCYHDSGTIFGTRRRHFCAESNAQHSILSRSAGTTRKAPISYLGPALQFRYASGRGYNSEGSNLYPGARLAVGIYKQPRVQLGRLQSCTRGPRCNGATQAAAGTTRTAPKRSP